MRHPPGNVNLGTDCEKELPKMKRLEYIQWRNRDLKEAAYLEAAFVERSSAIADALGVLEQRTDVRMQLEALELLVRTEIGVAVVEADDKANHHIALVVLFQVIDERSAVRIKSLFYQNNLSTNDTNYSIITK